MATVTAEETGAPAGDGKAQRLILRGGGSAAAGLVIRFAARLIFLFIAARLYGTILFGAYSLAVAIVELAVAAGLLGMKRLLFKLLDEDDSGRPPAHVVLDAAFVVAAASLAIAAALMIALAFPAVRWAAGETGFALMLIAPMIAGQALLDLFTAATRWKHRMRYEVIARSIVEPYAALAATAAAWLAGFDETGLLIGYWAGTLLALAYAVSGARRSFGGFGLRGYRLPRGRAGAILREGAVPTVSDGASALFGRLDLYLVGLFLGEAPAGIYNVARQVRTPIRQIRQSFDGLLTPIIARTLATRGTARTGQAVASAARMILAFQLPALLAVAVLGWPLLQWLGPEFAAGYLALVLLAAAETIQGAFGVGDLILLYRQPLLVLRITLAAVAVNLVAGWALIEAMGITGAALSVLIAIAASAAVRRMSLKSRFGIEVPLHHSAGPFAAALVAAAAAAGTVWLTPADGLVVSVAALAAALIFYAAVLKLWLAVTRDSLALVEFRAE